MKKPPFFFTSGFIRPLLSLSALGCGLLSIPTQALAATWSGGAADGLWSTGSNWTEGVVPAPPDEAAEGGDVALISTSGTINVDSAPWVRRLQLGGMSDIVLTGSLTLGASDSGSESLLWRSNTNTAATIYADLSFYEGIAGGVTYIQNGAAGVLAINGSIDLGEQTKGLVGFSNSTGAITRFSAISGNIAGAGNNSRLNLTLGNGGVMEFSGNSTGLIVGGGIYVNAGSGANWSELRLNHNNALGGNVLRLGSSDSHVGTNKARVLISDGATFINNDISIRQAAAWELGSESAGIRTFGGDILLRKNSHSSETALPVRLTASLASTTVHFSGDITSVAGDGVNPDIEKTGAGTVILSGDNNYLGRTMVAAGTLLINGEQSAATGSVVVQNGAVMGGRGIVGGATTFESGSTHAPGTSPGLQTFTGGLSYQSGSQVQWELIDNTDTGRGIEFDAIDVNGNGLSIAGNVTAQLSFNAVESTVDWSDSFWSAGRSWLVYDNAVTASLASVEIFDSVVISLDASGQSLDSIRSGASFHWGLEGNDLYLYYAIPEPSTISLLGLSALLLIKCRRRPTTALA